MRFFSLYHTFQFVLENWGKRAYSSILIGWRNRVQDYQSSCKLRGHLRRKGAREEGALNSFYRFLSCTYTNSASRNHAESSIRRTKALSRDISKCIVLNLSASPAKFEGLINISGFVLKLQKDHALWLSATLRPRAKVK